MFHRFRLRLAVSAIAIVVCSGRTLSAEVLVTNFFFNTVDLYDDQTLQLIQPGYFAANVGPGFVLGFAGLAVHPQRQQVFVSGRFSDQILVFDLQTGRPSANTPTGTPGLFKQLSSGAQPAGLAIDAAGNLYVANNGGISVDVFNSATGASVFSISDGGQSLVLPSGLTFDAQGRLFISSMGGTKLFTYAGGVLTPFAGGNAAGMPYVPSGVAVRSNGEVLVADVFTNYVFKYNAAGAEITGPGGSPFMTIDLPDTSGATHPNAPSGLAIDSQGQLIVAVLGPTNPFTPPYVVHGALMRFNPETGELVGPQRYELAPLSAIALASTGRTYKHWSGAAENGLLGDAGNWLIARPSPTDTIVFGSDPTSRALVNDGEAALRSVGGIIFNSLGYAIGGDTPIEVHGTIKNNASSAQISAPLTLGNGAAIDGGASSANLLTISGEITGNYGLTKLGNGKVFLSHDVAYLGDTIVAAGELDLTALTNGDSAIVSGTLTAGLIRQDSVTINPGGVIRISGNGTSVVTMLEIAGFDAGVVPSANAPASDGRPVPEPATSVLFVVCALAATAGAALRSGRPAGAAQRSGRPRR